MPPWLIVVLTIAGFIVFTGLMAAGATANWRTFWVATKQFSLFLLALAAPAIVVGAGMFIWKYL